MSSEEKRTCETCGAPATTEVIDMVEVIPTFDAYDDIADAPSVVPWKAHEVESTHDFCDTHVRPSQTTQTDECKMLSMLFHRIVILESQVAEFTKEASDGDP